MKAFDGFKPEERKCGYEQLPAGPYVAKIKNVKIDGQEPDQTLVLRLDVHEGPYTGYYARRYQNESSRKDALYEAKYKGDFRIRIYNPDNPNARNPEKDLANFNDAMFKIQESNPGYHWDWNERGLVGLLIGINVQQGTYNGHQFTRISKLEIVDKVRSGQVQTMAPMEPKSDAYEPPVDQRSGFQQVNPDELPF